MVIGTSYVFQTDSEEVNIVYKNNKNYIIETESNINKNISYCVIYFSSNDIYYPNAKEAFMKQVVNKNRFEWYKTRVKKASKHIFLRDIKKQWYLTGINSEINTIEKIFEFLKKETEGYNIITVGSSAGGYAAVLFGQLLKADISYSFNGQFMLSDLLQTSSESIDPILFREQYNNSINKYFSLRPYISTPESVYYFYSNRSKWDIIQKDHILDLGINIISFKTGHHGVPFLKSSLTSLLLLSKEELRMFSKKKQYPLIFSIKMEGLFNAIRSAFIIIVKLLIKKYNFKKYSKK